jgi:hypothetical protein
MDDHCEQTQPPLPERGAVHFEALVAIPFFLAFVAVTIELLRLAYVICACQIAAHGALRAGIIGPWPQSGISQGEFLRRETQRRAAQVAIPLPDFDIRVCAMSPNGVSLVCDAQQIGRPGDLVSVEIHAPVRLFFGTFQARASVVATNERW